MHSARDGRQGVSIPVRGPAGCARRALERGALGALLTAAAICAQAAGPAVRLVVQGAPLAGFAYYAAAEVWGLLRVGDALELAHEPDNPHDANAVSVAWHGRKLGYLPRRDNEAIAWGLARGERLLARISRLRAHPNPARRIEIEVYVE
jgi:hypothetical protein